MITGFARNAAVDGRSPVWSTVSDGRAPSVGDQYMVDLFLLLRGFCLREKFAEPFFAAGELVPIVEEDGPSVCVLAFTLAHCYHFSLHIFAIVSA